MIIRHIHAESIHGRFLIIDLFPRFQWERDRLHTRSLTPGPGAADRIQKILRCHRRAVRPEGVLPEMEGPDRRILIHLAGFCRPVLNVPVFIVCEQFVQGSHGIRQIGQGNGSCRIQSPGLAVDCHCNLLFPSGVFLSFCASGQCCRAEHGCRQKCCCQSSPFHAFSPSTVNGTSYL